MRCASYGICYSTCCVSVKGGGLAWMHIDTCSKNGMKEEKLGKYDAMNSSMVSGAFGVRFEIEDQW